MDVNIKILAIETSCDETAAAIISEENKQPVILSNIISSQADLHARTFGVVPEVASRAHMEAIIPVIQEALGNTPKTEITHLAVTTGPGLIGSLLVGFNAAKTLSYSLNLPIVPISHIEGHLYSVFAGLKKEEVSFPVLCLTASGGHTMLVLMKNHLEYIILGQTLDDAVGEAYDKVAKLLNLGYPGGPIISKLASKFREISSINNQVSNIVFPRPIINDGTFNFSFSGLKTAVLLKVREIESREGSIKDEEKEAVAAAFEEAVADVLTKKTRLAFEKYNPKYIAFAGGVSANNYLKERIKTALPEVPFLSPAKNLSGDNAAMIGIAAYYHILQKDTKSWQEIKVNSNLELV